MNFLTKVSKSKQKEPVICPKCHLFFDRIDVHLYSRHQLRRKENELKLLIEKSKTATKHFLEEFEKKKQLGNKDTEDATINIENRTEKVMAKTSKPTTTTTKANNKTSTSTPPKAKKVTTVTEQNKVQRTKPKITKSLSTETRLRGKYVQATAEKREHHKLLNNKLPLTTEKSKSTGLPSNTTLKFHYDNVDLLLDVYKEYMMKFQD